MHDDVSQEEKKVRENIYIVLYVLFSLYNSLV